MLNLKYPVVLLLLVSNIARGGEEDETPVPSPEVRQVAKANSQFAFDLYRQLSTRNKNKDLFFSPYSVSSVMAMVGEGARGRTAEEIGESLRYPDALRVTEQVQRQLRTDRINRGFAGLNALLNTKDDAKTLRLKAKRTELGARLMFLNARLQFTASRDTRREAQKVADQINELSRKTGRCTLEIANAAWIRKDFALQAEYTKTLEQQFGAGAFPCDFADPTGSARRINDWIGKKTRNQISDMVRPGHINPNLKLLLTNAVYFKGQWAEPFKASRTKVRDFQLVSGETIRTPIMYAFDGAEFGAFNADGSFFETPTRVPADRNERKKVRTEPNDDGFKLLKLPYVGDRLSMVVLLPMSHDGLEKIESKLSGDKLSRWIGQMKRRSVRQYIPKFRAETEYSLHTEEDSPLRDLGMRSVFTVAADLSGISESDPLKVSSVRHRAFVEVNETGTEAAAVTVVAPKETSVKPKRRQTIPFYPTFKAERPFLFAIRDNSTGTLLFVGRIHRPQDGNQPAAQRYGSDETGHIGCETLAKTLPEMPGRINLGVRLSRHNNGSIV